MFCLPTNPRSFPPTGRCVSLSLSKVFGGGFFRLEMCAHEMHIHLARFFFFVLQFTHFDPFLPFLGERAKRCVDTTVCSATT